VQQAKLFSSDVLASDEFGVAVAIDADTIVVGAFLDDDGGSASGSAYVFVRVGNTWTQQAKLTATDGAANDRLGRSVAIDGDTIVAGAFRDDVGGGDSGSAYVFTRTGSTWMQEAKLFATDGDADDEFGRTVAIDGDTIVVGAIRDEDYGTDSGSAYVFVRSGVTWVEEAKLVATDGAAGDEYGRAVAISGDTVIVGSFRDDDGGENAGSAYVFVRSGTSWTQEAKLLASDRAANDRFGRAVAVRGDSAAIGAFLDDDVASASGSVYLFSRTGTTWSEEGKLVAADGAANDEFARSLSFDGATLVAGSRRDDDNGDQSGSAYVFPCLGG
jgi:hypothetical protein